jgi:uncharacterized protein YutE (UPF0331/DUF86 family)
MAIPIDDICLNKASIMERALRRVKEEYRANPALDNFTHIDAMTLNIERACQAAIDLAMHIVARDRLGLPQSSAESFRLLHEAGHITKETLRNMTAMTGFRNIAIHEYQQMDMSILRAIAETRWQSLVEYCKALGLNVQP